MDPEISMITLGVKDLSVSSKFYRDGLGFPEYEWEGEIALFKTNGTWFALYPLEEVGEDADFVPDDTGCPRFTLAHIVDSRDDVDALLDEAGGGRGDNHPISTGSRLGRILRILFGSGWFPLGDRLEPVL